MFKRHKLLTILLAVVFCDAFVFLLLLFKRQNVFTQRTSFQYIVSSPSLSKLEPFIMPARNAADEKLVTHSGTNFRISYPSTWHIYRWGRGLPPDTIEDFAVHNQPQYLAQGRDDNKPDISVTVEINSKTLSLVEREQQIRTVISEYEEAKEPGYVISRGQLRSYDTLIWERTQKSRYEKKIYFVVNNKGYFLYFDVLVPDNASLNEVNEYFEIDFDRILATFYPQ